MPFTFSHPFIVLPLCRKENKWFSATGLITGSMVLDFEYFIYMKKIEHESFHTVPGGVFIFALPVGLLLMFVYHLLIRDQLIDNLPEGWWRRLAQFKQLDWNSYFRKNFIKVIVSLLIGIYSHLLLDAFTHDFGFIVKMFPVLKERVWFLNGAIPVYDILQPVLSLIGALVIAYAIYRIKPEAEITRQRTDYLKYWLFLGSAFFVVMLIRFLADTNHNKPVDILIAGIASSLIAICVCSMWLKIVFVRREQ
jgi:membrane-bound metal-dependent hydrolase YbcI (DUF457 family)